MTLTQNSAGNSLTIDANIIFRARFLHTSPQVRDAFKPDLTVVGAGCAPKISSCFLGNLDAWSRAKLQAGYGSSRSKGILIAFAGSSPRLPILFGLIPYISRHSTSYAKQGSPPWLYPQLTVRSNSQSEWILTENEYWIHIWNALNIFFNRLAIRNLLKFAQTQNRAKRSQTWLPIYQRTERTGCCIRIHQSRPIYAGKYRR